MSDYKNRANKIKPKLDAVSPTLCLAKWLQVSLHLTNGKTHSCYHPPVHDIPVDMIERYPDMIHNTPQKKEERKQMMLGERPEGCSYCWKIEDTPGDHYSDRIYRSGEYWAEPYFEQVMEKGWKRRINPTYVEVNFNQACNLKCSYCSPHLSTTWEDEIKEFGPYPTITPHNNVDSLRDAGMMPLRVKNSENPYVKAFWKWWPELYEDLRMFRMTGGEPLMDKNTFKVLDYIQQIPNKNLELSITSNFNPPDNKLFDKFNKQVAEITQHLWKVVCFFESVLLPRHMYFAEKDGKHYWLKYDEQPLDEMSQRILTGELCCHRYQGNDGQAVRHEFETVNLWDFIRQEYLDKIDDNWQNHDVFNPVILPSGTKIYSTVHTWYKAIINKDFFREQQLIDLGINDMPNIDLAYVKERGYTHLDDKRWWDYNQDRVDDESYLYTYDVTAPAVEHVMLFCSLDSVGKQLEYSRFGSNYNTILQNVKTYLANDYASLSFINTFNLFSVYAVKDWLQMILDLRAEFSITHQKVWFDVPLLEYPKWQCINILPPDHMSYLEEAVQFMKDHHESNYAEPHRGFKDYEIDKMHRNLEWYKTYQPDYDELVRHQIDFYKFFTEYDRRRKTNLLETFPELTEFWEECKDAAQGS